MAAIPQESRPRAMRNTLILQFLTRNHLPGNIDAKKEEAQLMLNLFLQVGVTGLEPATTRPPDAYANQLRHTPSWLLGDCSEWGSLPICECKSTAFFRMSKLFWHFFAIIWAKKCNFVRDKSSPVVKSDRRRLRCDEIAPLQEYIKGIIRKRKYV